MNYETLVRLRTMPAEELADIAFRMADKHPETFLELIAVGGSKRFKVPNTESSYVTLKDADIKRLRAYGPERKVIAIKEVREIACIGLKEAKDLVEAEFIK